jgi:hypothetical protein
VLYQQTTLERLARSDEAARYRTRGLLEGFQCNDPTTFHNDEIASSRVDNSHTGSMGGEIHQKAQFGSKTLLGSVITTKSHHKKDSMVGCKITNRCIAFGSHVASFYAQSDSITFEQEKSDNDVNSVLTASSSQ